jgi:hypothetical protein
MLRVRARVCATVCLCHCVGSAGTERDRTSMCGRSELAAAPSVQGMRFVSQGDAAALCRFEWARSGCGSAALVPAP